MDAVHGANYKFAIGPAEQYYLGRMRTTKQQLNISLITQVEVELHICQLQKKLPDTRASI